MKKIVIIGSGGHGKVVYDAIKQSNEYEVVGFVDAKVPVGTIIMDQQEVRLMQSDLHLISTIADYFIVAVGNNGIRCELFEKALNYAQPATIIHPSAIIGQDVIVEEGSVVLANAVIATESKIGKNTIINAGVIVDHESIVGSHVHLSIGTLVGSNSSIADGLVTSIGHIIPTFSTVE